MPISAKAGQSHIFFSKYQGAGNDFILIEDFERQFPVDRVCDLCDRQTGIGADGLILARHSAITDYEMVFYNRDGGLGAMCGNGLRCFVHFLRDLGHLQSLYSIEICKKILTVKVERSKISTFLAKPSIMEWKRKAYDHEIYVVDTGVPHAVIFVDQLGEFVKKAEAIRSDTSPCKEGVNVNFAKQLAKDRFAVRTYERGVEGETLACGTGAAAVAFTAHELSMCSSHVHVQTRSGAILEIDVGDQICVSGPSEKVFAGSIQI